jgi:ribosomal protein S28E/S33
MYTLRCTQKLLARGLEADAIAQPEPTTLLGDWYANVIICNRQHVVLCMSERTLLPVLLPAKDAKSLPFRLADATCEVLGRLGIEPGAVQVERKRMEGVRVGRTASRRLLGSLNDFMFQLEVGLKSSPERTLIEQALWLAETPCKPIEYASPEIATRALFQSAAMLARVSQNAL